MLIGGKCDLKIRVSSRKNPEVVSRFPEYQHDVAYMVVDLKISNRITFKSVDTPPLIKTDISGWRLTLAKPSACQLNSVPVSWTALRPARNWKGHH